MNSIIKDPSKLYLQLTTPLGPNKLILTEFSGEEKMSSLFEFDLVMYSTDADVDFKSVVEKSATITLDYGTSKRYINGIISHIYQGKSLSQPSSAHKVTYYYAKLRPKAWNMALTENIKIFQNKTYIAIIKEVLGNSSITFKDNTSSCGTTEMEFYVQYNESDFDFISRTMESQGISYYFTHEDGSHTMVLYDASSPYETCSGAATINVLAQNNKDPYLPGITVLEVHQMMVPSSFAVSDYNFTTPDTSLYAKTAGVGQGKDMYHYPGNHLIQSAGETVSGLRVIGVEFPQTFIRAEANIPFPCPGTKFTLKGSDRSSANTDYAFFSVHHKGRLLDDGDEVERTDPFQAVYTNTLQAFPTTLTYRPPLKTPLPIIAGTQTATVTGKAGEEIWTDKYGRIKVKFHWDISGTENEKTSCWIRVAQGWAGNNWGILFTPRIGHEVVVSFINGDPSYPLITGSVYNADHLPPYLPDTPTKSTIKSNTTKGGGGFNEFRFEDKKGEEEIYMHAQKDVTVYIIHNRTETIQKGHDFLTIEEGDKSLTLQKGNQTITLQEGNRTRTLQKGDESVTLQQGNRTMTLQQGNSSLTLNQGDMSVTLDQGNSTTTLSQGNMSLTLSSGNLTIDVTGNIDITGQAVSLTAQSLTVTTEEAITVEAGEAISVTAGEEFEVSAGAAVSLDAADAFTLSAGAAMTISASAALTGSAGAALTLSSGSAFTVNSSSVVSINGQMVSIA